MTATMTRTATVMASDNTLYSFETGMTMNFTQFLHGVTGSANSMDKAYLGTHSLRVDGTFTSTTGGAVYTQSPLITNLEGKQLKARIWIPSDFGSSGGTIFIQSGTGWCWEQSTWVNFTAGAWNEMVFNPETSTTSSCTGDHSNIKTIGIIFQPAASYTGSVYIDSIEVIEVGTLTITPTRTQTMTFTVTRTPGGPTDTFTSTPTVTSTFTLTPVPAPGDANDSNIQYYGRWNMSDVQNPKTGWGTSYIVTKFDGTSIAIKLSDTNSSSQYFAYSIDGSEFTRFQIAGTTTTLATALSDTTHTFTLVRRTEGYVGITTFSGFVLDSGKTLQAPDARPARKMEFIGDSITCGYGTEGSGSNLSDENGYVSYASQLARLFGAEWTTISKSGIGLYLNYSETTHVDGAHMIDYYPRTYYNNGTPAWDFSFWMPDVVVIALGTNDFWNGAPDESAFETAYSDLVDYVRGKYPNAYIFCTEPIPSWVGAIARTYISNVVAAKNTAGDAGIYWMAVNSPSALLSAADYIGDYTHPTPAGHTIVANYMYASMHATLNPLNGW